MKTATRWLLFVFQALFVSVTSRAEVIIQPVAVSGQPAPGTSAKFQNFTDVQINDAGQVMFIAQLSGVGVESTNNSGMWSGLPGEMALAVRKGSPVPGYGPGVAFFYFGLPLLTKSGSVAFYARLQGPGISTDAFESGNDDTLWAAIPAVGARASSSEPPVLLHEVGALGGHIPYLLNNMPLLGGDTNQCLAVKVIALATLLAGDKAQGLEFLAWVKKNCIDKPSAQIRGLEQNLSPRGPYGFAKWMVGQTLSAIAFSGDPAPGTLETFDDIDPDSLVASELGKLAFFATISHEQSGIWSGTTTNLRPIALSGASLPASLQTEFGPNAVWGFNFAINLCINGQGEVAFTPRLGPATYLLTGPPEAPRVAAGFVPLNSTNEGFFYAQKMVMNAGADVAFIGGHTSLREISGIGGRPGEGVQALGVAREHGAVQVLLSEGRSAPGLREGEVVSFLGVEGGPFMNQQGQVVFHAEIGTAYGFDHTTDNGIWLINPTRGVQLVARGGTRIDLGGGRIGTIEARSVYFVSSHNNFRSGGEDGRPKTFNDLGQVVFVASWREADGTLTTGVLVAGEVQVLAGKLAGNDIEVSFASAKGRRYRIDFRSAVDSGAWATLKDGVDGTGGPIVVNDIGAANLPKRFYRVAALP